MRIYLDNCCYNRPFDDQTQERIHIESEAILAILQRSQEGIYTIIGSDILELEINQSNDLIKRQRVSNLYSVASEIVKYSDDIASAAKNIMSVSNIKLFDSLHIASAQAGNADVFLTTDDKLEKMSSKLMLSMRILNPLKFLMEDFLYD